ncbi:MAG: ATP-dependent helicase [Phycisphaerae bacterium]
MGVERLFDGLTDPQREAVSHVEGPLLVLAGAGSGKTRVITRRAAHIASTVARPDEVLAITFTNKAAGEMRERIAALGIRGGVGGPWGRGRMWVSTFHSLCARLLREYGDAVGVRPNFSIFDEADRRAVIREAVAARGLSADHWRPRTVEAVISDAKNRMLGPEAYADEVSDFTSKTIAGIYAQYQLRLHEQNACDFDDLLMSVATLLQSHEDVRGELSRRFRYLLIDEYQDTNHAQYLIATRLAFGHRNICVTGDPDQSIYAWRGADLRNILDFEADYPDATTVRLEQNYRSAGAILSAASCLIKHNRRRKSKELWTEQDSGTAVRVWPCEDERDEARRIAEDIRQQSASGSRAGDVAIFYRVNAVTRVLEEALRAAGVPYQIARGVEFYGRKEIKDVLAYLRAVVNPADDTAILRAIHTPARGIGKVTVGRLKAHAAARGITLGEALSEVDQVDTLKAARKKLGLFAEMLARLRELPSRPVTAVIEQVLARSGIESALSAAGEVDNDALANVYELVSAARQYDIDNPDGGLAEWLHQISLVTDIDSLEMSGGAVTLMTLHAAKGLEFPIVYIVGLEDGLLPHRRALNAGDEDVEEERRLCFVGMTRAMRRLTMSHAYYRMIRGLSERTLASRFLTELPVDEVEVEPSEPSADRSHSHLRRYNEGDEGTVDVSRFQPGRVVTHPEYGSGRVLAVEPRGGMVYVRVCFDAFGTRAFALDYATQELTEC